MSEAPKRIWAWQDPTGSWHTNFSEDPEYFYLHLPPDDAYYVRADIADEVRKALRELVDAGGMADYEVWLRARGALAKAEEAT